MEILYSHYILVTWQMSQHGIAQNIVINIITFVIFIIQPPQDPENSVYVLYDYMQEIWTKAAIGKSGYYAKDVFVVGFNSKLFIKANGVSNIAQECGPTTRKMRLAFNVKRHSHHHMNIKVSLCLGYKQRKTNPADSNNYNCEGIVL